MTAILQLATCEIVANHEKQAFVRGYCVITSLSLAHISRESEAHSELCQTSKLESFNS